MKSTEKISLASVFLTFFVDNLCWSIVFPIFAPYFLDTSNNLFSPDISEKMRTTILGLFLMAFSFGQFIGAPIIGEYGDRHGRRRALLLTVPSTLIGLLLTAISMKHYMLYWLFFARLITGIFASNGSICLAAVSDLSENESAKTRNFGYFSIIAGLSFVVGAFVGGKLSDPTIDPRFGPEFPLQMAAILTGFNFLFIFFGFRETMKMDLTKKFSFFHCFENIKIALSKREIHNIYAIYFLFIFAWNILLQFIPVIMIKRFSFTESNIGDLALYVGMCWIIGSGHLKQWLSAFFTTAKVMKICFLILPIFTAFVIFPSHIYYLLTLLGICTLIGGITWPLCTSLISNLAPQEMQGKILSISQSVQSLAMATGPVIAGLSYKISPYAPFLTAAFAFLLAGLLPIRTKKVTS